MSFGGGKTNALPAPTQKALGLDESRASTNEQARPVPYLAGKTRVGVTWITDAFDVKTDAVTSSAGKGQTMVTGYNYYASLLALVCHGPVDLLEAIYFNGDLVWEGPLARGVDIVTEITLENHGVARIFWGTDQQEVEEKLNGSGQFHPPYLRQCLIFFDQVYFGFNQTNAPNVELIVGRYPAWPWEDETAEIDVDGDCNPVAVIAELLTSKIFGLGWPVSRLDTAALGVVAAQLETEGIGIAPYITRQTSARQLITQVLEYCDGYPILTAEGKFSIGLMRSPADVGALPLIDESVLVDEPELEPESWRGVKTKTWVKFMDRSRSYKENALPYRAPGVAQLAGDNTQQTLERLWATKPQFAQMMVAAAGRAAALPATSGSVAVRKSASLKPGDLFRLSYDHLGIEELVMRVVSRSQGKAGARTVTLDVLMDRAYLNDAYYLPDDDTVPGPVDTDPEPFDLDKVAIMELPRGLAEGQQITLTPFPVRPNIYTTGFNIHLRRNYNLATVQLFALGVFVDSGTLGADYPPLYSVIDESFTLTLNYSSSLDAQLTTLAEEYRLVIERQPAGSGGVGGHQLKEKMIVIGWVVDSPGVARAAVIRARGGTTQAFAPSGQSVNFQEHAASLVPFAYDQIGDMNRFAVHGTLAADYPATTDLIDLSVGFLVDLTVNTDSLESPSLDNAFNDTLLAFVGGEIISVAEVELVSTSRYRVWGIRGRYDTHALAHLEDEPVFIMASAALKRLTHASFLRGSRHAFKLQPKVLSRALGLDEVDPVGYTITDRVHAPRCPANLMCAGDGRAPHLSYGDDAELSWTLTESAPRDFWGRWGNAAVVNAQTIVEIRDSADDLVRTLPMTAAGATTATYDQADRVADFGIYLTAFKVRIYAYENGLRSLLSTELTVTVNPLF